MWKVSAIGLKAAINSDWLSAKLASAKLMRIKKVQSCLLVEYWSDSTMLPPCSKMKCERAATMPGRSGHDIKSVMVGICCDIFGPATFPKKRVLAGKSGSQQATPIICLYRLFCQHVMAFRIPLSIALSGCSSGKIASFCG